MGTFTSTRGNQASLEAALFEGLAQDGGLYMPDPMPRVRPLSEHGSKPAFLSVACKAASDLLEDSLPSEITTSVVADSLTFPVPLIEVDPGVHVLELFHGPTHAFKDFGARFMARLMSTIDPYDINSTSPRTVLVATSGDTGSAVANAVHRLPGYRVVVLFPRDGVSARQRRQMTTLGDNVTSVAVAGTFDDCQRLAKEAFGSASIRAQHRLTSANSINIGRLLPQALYYMFAAASLDDPPRFSVPCGNLGNLCAGIIARSCGMSTHSFLAATNVNDSFATFLNTGMVGDRESISTISNAMDVGSPSNLERIRWMHEVSPEPLQNFVSSHAIDDDDTRKTIRDVFSRTGYVLDPHSAVAYRAQQRRPAPAGVPTVVLATAHPAKFPEVVEQAIGVEVPLPPGLASVIGKDEHFLQAAPTLSDIEAILSRIDTIE